MENRCKQVMPHPQLLEVLFAFKSQVSKAFKDVIGLHEIHHMALTRINKKNELVTFSTTPALEFNLFSGSLWQHDRTYQPEWFNLCSQAYWQTLYKSTRYDELYYVKQIKHRFPIGLSLAGTLGEDHLIYSIASRNSCRHTQDLFQNQQEEFYKIGQFCYNALNPLFSHCDALAPEPLPSGPL